MGWDISQSAMGIFIQCPYAYKLSYIDRHEAVFWNPDALDIGGIVHDVIDEYYKYHYISTGTSDDVLLRTYEIFKEKWAPTYSIDDFKKAYTCLQSHAVWEARNISKGINTKPLTEADLRQGGYHGILDYVDLNRGIVIDWKTNKYPTVSHTYRIQAYIYKTLYEKEFNQKLKHFYFFFLYPNEFRKIGFDNPKQEEAAKEAEEMKKKILEAIKEEKFEKMPRTKSGCKNCSYKLYCKFWGGEDAI